MESILIDKYMFINPISDTYTDQFILQNISYNANYLLNSVQFLADLNLIELMSNFVDDYYATDFFMRLCPVK